MNMKTKQLSICLNVTTLLDVQYGLDPNHFLANKK
jgi:hypothetical protein